MNSVKNNGLVMLVMAKNSVNLQHLSAIRTTVLLHSYGRSDVSSVRKSQTSFYLHSHFFVIFSVRQCCQPSYHHHKLSQQLKAAVRWNKLNKPKCLVN